MQINGIHLFVMKIFPHISVHCMLLPVQYGLLSRCLQACLLHVPVKVQPFQKSCHVKFKSFLPYILEKDQNKRFQTAMSVNLLCSRLYQNNNFVSTCNQVL